MKKMCYVCLYLSYLDAMDNMSDQDVGASIRALLHYAATDSVVFPKSSLSRLVFRLMKGQHDRDRERYEEKCRASRENGKKGGRPKKQRPDEPELIDGDEVLISGAG